MKLLFFINSLAAGGAERVTVNLANYWALYGWDVHLVTISPIRYDFYGLDQRVKRWGLDFEDDNRSTLWSLRLKIKTVFALRRLLNTIQPNVAISMMTDANIILSISALGLDAIYLIGSERIYPPLALNKKKHWEWLRKYTYGGLDAMVALTEENRQWLSENTLAKQIEVIGNPLIWPLPEFLPLLSPKKYLNPEKKHLLAVGRLHPQKQFDLLIRVFKRIAGDYKDWDLVILGDGEDRSMLECLVADLGLGESVSLPGVAGNLSEWYYKADAFVLSSAFEGFPNVLLEAMAHGIPVVSFDCNTGPRDLIEHGKNGLLVPDGDTAGLEQAIRELLSSEDFRNELGEHAKEVRQQYSIARIAGRWEKVFSGLWSG